MDGASYETLAQALEGRRAVRGGQDRHPAEERIRRLRRAGESRSSGAALTLPAGVTLNGQGHTVT